MTELGGFGALYMHYYTMFADIDRQQIEEYESEHGEGSWADYDPTEF